MLHKIDGQRTKKMLYNVTIHNDHEDDVVKMKIDIVIMTLYF